MSLNNTAENDRLNQISWDNIPSISINSTIRELGKRPPEIIELQSESEALAACQKRYVEAQDFLKKANKVIVKEVPCTFSTFENWDRKREINFWVKARISFLP